MDTSVARKSDGLAEARAGGQGRGAYATPLALVGLAAAGALVSWIAARLAQARRREAEAADYSRAAEAVRQSEWQFRTAFENGAVAMALTSMDYKLLRVNAVFCRMLGFSEAELIGRRFTEITHPDDLEINLSGAEALCRGEAPSFRMEKRYIRKDGTVIWGDMGAATVCDPQGHPLYFVTHIQDITQRKRAEEKLRRAEARVAQAVRVAGLGIFEHDHRSDLIEFSAGLREMLSFAEEELITIPAFLERVLPEDRERVAAVIRWDPLESTCRHASLSIL